MKIQITPEIKSRAKKDEEDIIRTGLYKTPNYTGLHAPSRFYTGYIGEYAFEALLKKYNCRFLFDPKPTGKADYRGDFKVRWFDNSVKVIDVKTNNYNSRIKDYLAVPNSQIKKRYDIYVGANIDDVEEWIEFFGWLYFGEWHPLSICLIPSVGAHRSRCIIMRELLGYIKKRET